MQLPLYSGKVPNGLGVGGIAGEVQKEYLRQGLVGKALPFENMCSALDYALNLYSSQMSKYLL